MEEESRLVMFIFNVMYIDKHLCTGCIKVYTKIYFIVLSIVHVV